MALDRQIDQTSEGIVNLPIIGVAVDPKLVWATGPMVIGFVLLAATGTLEALGVAYEKISTSISGEMFEAMDTFPTAIDLFVYSPARTRLSRAGLSAYPIFFTVFGLEASFLWVKLLSRQTSVDFSTALLISGALLIAWGWWRILKLWRSKFQAMFRSR